MLNCGLMHHNALNATKVVYFYISYHFVARIGTIKAQSGSQQVETRLIAQTKAKSNKSLQLPFPSGILLRSFNQNNKIHNSHFFSNHSSVDCANFISSATVSTHAIIRFMIKCKSFPREIKRKILKRSSIDKKKILFEGTSIVQVMRISKEKLSLNQKSAITIKLSYFSSTSQITTEIFYFPPNSKIEQNFFLLRHFIVHERHFFLVGRKGSIDSHQQYQHTKGDQ